MGADNIPFHTIMLPASLIGTKDNYNLVNKIFTSKIIKYQGDVFSKSSNKGTFCDKVIDISNKLNLNNDWRYYLIKIRPENNDSNFTWQGFVDECNADLANNFGNLVNRCFNMARNYRNNTIQCIDLFENENTKTLFSNLSSNIESYHNLMESGNFKNAQNIAILISSIVNKTIIMTKPWDIFKQYPNSKDIDVFLVFCLISIKISCLLLNPFIPDSAQKISNRIIITPSIDEAIYCNQIHFINELSDVMISIDMDNYEIPFKKIIYKQIIDLLDAK